MGRGFGEVSVTLADGELLKASVKAWEVLDCGALYLTMVNGTHIALAHGHWSRVSVTRQEAL